MWCISESCDKSWCIIQFILNEVLEIVEFAISFWNKEVLGTAMCQFFSLMTPLFVLHRGVTVKLYSSHH